jgi:hypothetical protein
MRPTDRNERSGLKGLALAMAVGGLCMTAPCVAAAQEAPLQVSYTTDNYLTCDSLKDELVRMDAIIALRPAAAVVKTATERKALIGGLFKTKGCATAKPAETQTTRAFLSPY